MFLGHPLAFVGAKEVVAVWATMLHVLGAVAEESQTAAADPVCEEKEEGVGRGGGMMTCH